MEPLTTLDLNRTLSNNKVTGRYFLGTYPACVTPKTFKSKFSFITNVDEHGELGMHWNAWFIKGSEISFFDSFGREYDDETLPGHYTNIVEEYDRIHCTTDRIQGWESVTCGQFSTHFIYTLSLGLDYNSFLKEYSSNFPNNDLIVVDFYNSLQ